MEINLWKPPSCQTTRVDITKARRGELADPSHLPLDPLISFHQFRRRFFTALIKKTPRCSLPHPTVTTGTSVGCRMLLLIYLFFPSGRLCVSPPLPPTPQGHQSDLVRQQVGDRKDERGININSPPRPPFCVLKYLIILGAARLLRRPSQSRSLRQDRSCSCLNEGLVQPHRRSRCLRNGCLQRIPLPSPPLPPPPPPAPAGTTDGSFRPPQSVHSASLDPVLSLDLGAVATSNQRENANRRQRELASPGEGEL